MEGIPCRTVGGLRSHENDGVSTLTFARPELLWLLMILPGLALWAIRGRQKRNGLGRHLRSEVACHGMARRFCSRALRV